MILSSTVRRFKNALLGIATMDVYTRPGEKPAHEVMREIAAEALNIDAGFTEEPKQFVMAVPGDSIRFPFIYKPNFTHDAPKGLTWGITVDGCWRREIYASWAKYANDRGLIIAKSKTRVEVGCLNGMSVLVRALQEVDASNQPRDSVFKLFNTVHLTVEPYTWKNGLDPVRHSLKLLRVELEGIVRR